MKKLAIIGAGLAGLVLARELREAFNIVVYEKSHRPGGRLTSSAAGPWVFDHGAQFFLSRHASLQPLIDRLVSEGVLGCWNARFCEFVDTRIAASRQWHEAFPHYVGTPSMDALGERLARDLNLETGTCVGHLRQDGDRWQLDDVDGRPLGRFDWVVAAAPGPQSEALLPTGALSARAPEQPPMRACNALMLGFEQAQALEWQAALVRNADISWMSVNSSKPGRDEPFSMVALSTNAWADTHLELDDDKVIEHLQKEVGRVAAIDAGAAVHVGLKRWRFANVTRQSRSPCFVDSKAGLAACGDWFVQGRVEGAFASAVALADALRRGRNA